MTSVELYTRNLEEARNELNALKTEVDTLQGMIDRATSPTVVDALKTGMMDLERKVRNAAVKEERCVDQLQKATVRQAREAKERKERMERLDTLYDEILGVLDTELFKVTGPSDSFVGIRVEWKEHPEFNATVAESSVGTYEVSFGYSIEDRRTRRNVKRVSTICSAIDETIRCAVAGRRRQTKHAQSVFDLVEMFSDEVELKAEERWVPDHSQRGNRHRKDGMQAVGRVNVDEEHSVGVVLRPASNERVTFQLSGTLSASMMASLLEFLGNGCESEGGMQTPPDRR